MEFRSPPRGSSGAAEDGHRPRVRQEEIVERRRDLKKRGRRHGRDLEDVIEGEGEVGGGGVDLARTADALDA
jgi:hypothetical protein